MAGGTRFQELDTVFTALAHAARRQILMMIWFEGGVLSSGEIAARFKYAWPTVVRHLRVLELAGLLTHTKEGRIVSYKVNEVQLGIVKEWLDWFGIEFRGSTHDPRKKTKTRKQTASLANTSHHL